MPKCSVDKHKRKSMGTRKSKVNEESMSEPRNFGSPAGQVAPREPLSPILFMKVGTRVGTITAYYQHVNPVPFSSYPPSSPTPQNSPVAPVVRVPAVRFLTPPATEQAVPLPESSIYDVPKKL